MKTVWKYKIDFSEYQELNIPRGAEILSLQMQGSRKEDDISLWCLVDTEAPKEVRKFAQYGTGENIDREIVRHIGTLQFFHGTFVTHVFEVK